MVHAEKIAVVSSYLGRHFPGCLVSDGDDLNRHAHRFRIHDKVTAHLLTVAKEFFEDHSASQISAALELANVAEVLRNAGVAHVLLTNHGTCIEP